MTRRDAASLRCRAAGGAAAAAIVLAVTGAGCERLPTGPARATHTELRGITFVDWSADGYDSPSARRSLGELAATGANVATVIVTAYQADRFADGVRSSDPRTPSPGAIRKVLAEARARGLAVAVQPHVDLDDGSWRGHIEPRDPEAWFRSYREYILPLAMLADSVGAVHFVVGTELARTLRHGRSWHATVTAVRAVFGGALVYAASWDEAGQVPFWSALDLVGVNFYSPVAARRSPGRFEILAGWQPWLARLERLHRKAGRPVLLTEIGYRSVVGAALHPYRFGNDAAVDFGEQADLYWAALEATGNQPWIAGLSWWNWPAWEPGAKDASDFTPRGKPAAEELRRAWWPRPPGDATASRDGVSR